MRPAGALASMNQREREGQRNDRHGLRKPFRNRG